MAGKCAVCGQAGRKRKGYMRVLCEACAQAAALFTGLSTQQRGWVEGASDSYYLGSPDDGNIDTYEHKNRRLEE